jgi:hypothetical protein
MRLQRKWLAWGAAAAFGALLVYAWIDGGRRPLHEISQSVPVPEMRR